MLFNEEQMRNLCKEYGIDVVEENGYPMLNNIEITSEDIKAAISDHNVSATGLSYTFYSVKNVELNLNLKDTIYCNDMNFSFAA